ncbi:MAG: hypothetical protein ABSG64_09905 [Solirubrobacteraceae bacterium]
MLIALIAATITSVAAADASGVLGPDWNLSTPSPLGTAQSVPSVLSSAFAVMRRAPQPGDALPSGAGANAVAGGVAAHYGINTSLSRFVGTIDGTSFWLVAGSTGACLYTSNQGSICARDDPVVTSGFVGAGATFVGALPDGASITAANSDGSAAQVLRSGAAFEVPIDARLQSVTIHEANGNEETLPSPGNAALRTPAGNPPIGTTGASGIRTGPSGSSGQG